MTVQQPTQLTAAANLTIVACNQTFTIYGTLTTADGAPISGETIQLQRNVSGTWTDVSGKKSVTGAGGAYSIVLSESFAGAYEYRANYTGNAVYAGSHSAPVAVTVKPLTRLTASSTASTVVVGQTFIIYGTLSNASGAPVSRETIQLQRNVSGTWTDVSGKKNTTSAAGTYIIAALNENTLGAYEYRANFAGNAVYAGSSSASVFVTVQQPTQLTAAANLTIVACNQTFTIYGTLTTADGAPISGETIQLQRNVSGTWTDVSGKKSVTGAGGAYSIVLSESFAGAYEYRANFAGRATNAGSHSASVVVIVKPLSQLTASATPSTVLVGQTFTISGTLTNVIGGPITKETIQLQRNVSGTWTDVSGKTNITSATGSYSISLNENTLGVYEYRANFAGNAVYAGSSSASVFVTVQQPTQLTAAANLTIVACNQTFTIYGTLTTADGAPISGETIQLQRNVSGTWTDVSGKKSVTGAGGAYSIVLSESFAGAYEYRANFAGRATNAGSHSASVVVIVKPATYLTGAVNPPTIMVNQTFTFYGALTTADGAPMSSETIQLQRNINGTWTDVSGKTDATSATASYSISLNEGTAGVYEYRANYTGNAVYAGSSSASVFVTINKPIELTATQLTATAKSSGSRQQTILHY